MSEPLKRLSDAQTRQQKVWMIVSSLIRSSKYLFLYILLPSMLLVLGRTFYHRDMEVADFLFYGENLYSTIGVLIVLWLLAQAYKTEEEFLVRIPRLIKELDRRKVILFFAFGVTSAFSFSFIITMIGRIGLFADFFLNYTTQSESIYEGRDLFLAILGTTLLAPIVEELIFRGHMLDTLLETFEEQHAIIICTIIFALCHVNSIWIAYALFMGYIMARTSIKEDTVLYGTFLHIGFNLPSAFITILMLGGHSAIFEDNFIMCCLGGISICAMIMVARLYQQEI